MQIKHNLNGGVASIDLTSSHRYTYECIEHSRTEHILHHSPGSTTHNPLVVHEASGLEVAPWQLAA